MTDEDALRDALRNLAPLTTDEQREKMTAPGALLAAALWYASIGWPVFPCVPGGKVPQVSGGFTSATTDEAMVRVWWGEVYPRANIGVPTGVAFDVIDIDAPDGYETWSAYLDHSRQQGHDLPGLYAVAHTGSGGRHLLIPPQRHGNGASLGRGLDYRGTGGYVVLPPSVLSAGGLYSWLKAPLG